MSRSPRARTDDDAPPTDWLGELPPELHLRILEGVDDFSDCAAFSLASPRLGLLALRSGLARFKDPLFAVAMRLLLIERLHAGSFVGAPIMDTLNEATLRAYAADRRASADNFPWLARVSPALRLSSEVTGAGASRAEYWRLRRGEENGAMLRRRLLQSGMVQHYEGERGRERKVRLVIPSGKVQHYEGERGRERKVRLETADGTVQYCEGEQGAERKVRLESNGYVQHYEGEKGAERMVRSELPDGSVAYYEGERGEGERGAERMVRAEFPSGIVKYYEGEKGAERMVRVDAASL
ncbi:hypothetical protein EMIHUDRAFT_309296 [Emiliania huxleyi CCMP1516]|uniref:F-box domain-containing protein n=2 Tax=Emiliania huxleyi TaxID=2903 RepID=A0A0D3KM02_EMIH1|nr:hypothetical protein EMIHUDRAFT_309296 [Emiliania huxleyi CCMP1516]EOD36787.1 hypothetical protein EMIHUDRAFT_309296 [Emiliania huxleyi CCMP1516]|eukprot:XP_005789216.1 hypothetical protein EMIHUDRAFT_309296 [Emiliania huxleyi CCMP1516]